MFCKGLEFFFIYKETFKNIARIFNSKIRKKTRIRNPQINPLFWGADFCQNPNPTQKLGGLPALVSMVVI